MDSELSPILEALYRGDADAAAVARAERGELDVLEAAALGEVDELRRILAADPAAAGTWSSDGFTPLHYAAFFGHPDAARVLIDAGAELEAPSRNTQFAQDARPLHSAAAAREHEVARLLLEAGADPNAEQHGGFTPLRQADENDDEELAALLRQYGATR
jgi:ankyrin repeat protein